MSPPVGVVFVKTRPRCTTFNTATVEVTGARAGDLLVYNMNYDEGWHSEDGRVVNHDATVALVLPEGAARVTLRYTPPGLGAGLVLAAVTVLGLLAFGRREARLRGRAGEAAA